MVSEIATRVLVQALRRAGWSPARTVGSHTTWKCPTGRHQTLVADGHRTITPGPRRNIEKAMTSCDCEEDQ